MKPTEVKTVEQRTGITFGESGKEVNGVIWGTSFYTTLRGKKIRMSDHAQTSPNREKPNYNHVIGYSSVNALVDYIEELKSMPCETVKQTFLKPIFTNQSEITKGFYKLADGRKAEIIAINSGLVETIFDGEAKTIAKKYVMNWETKIQKEVVVS